MCKLHFAWILAPLTLPACLDLEANPPPAPASTDSARAVVDAWQAAALRLEDGKPEPLVAHLGAPFTFVAGRDVAGFRAADAAEARRELAVRDRLAMVHTAARVAEAAGSPPAYETPRRGEIVASLGGDRGYTLTLRRSPNGWRIVRFEIRARSASRD